MYSWLFSSLVISSFLLQSQQNNSQETGDIQVSPPILIMLIFFTILFSVYSNLAISTNSLKLSSTALILLNSLFFWHHCTWYPFIFNPARMALFQRHYFHLGFRNTTKSYLTGWFTVSFVGSFSLIKILPWNSLRLSLRLFIYTRPTWTQSFINFNIFMPSTHFSTLNRSILWTPS